MINNEIIVTINNDATLATLRKGATFQFEQKTNNVRLLIPTAFATSLGNAFGVKINFLRADGSVPTSRDMWIVNGGKSIIFDGKTYIEYDYLLSEFQLGKQGTLKVGFSIYTAPNGVRKTIEPIDVEVNFSVPTNLQELPIDGNAYTEAVENLNIQQNVFNNRVNFVEDAASKATEASASAVTTATSAKATADSAARIANGIDFKATTAENNSSIALTKSTFAESNSIAALNDSASAKDAVKTTDGKAEQSIKSISLDSANGILTITKTNGTISTIDLPLEYMVQSGRYDAVTKNIVLELAGGTTIEIPAAALVNEYYGDNSTITAYTDTADGNKVKFKLSDTVLEKLDSNTNARHIHANKAILEAISAAFTTSLKTTYDGYSLPISENANAISAEITARQKEITRVENVITTKQGTVVTVGGVAQNKIAFTTDPQTEIDGKLDKLKCQYSKGISLGDSGVLFIGSFPIYDSNITIDISSTTAETYNARLIIACQNYQILSAETYGDATNTTTQNIFIKPSSSSDVFVDVYFSPQLWSKNIIEIKGEHVRGIPTHICEIIPSIPANATLHPTNTLGCKESRPIVLYDKNNSDANINWGYPSGIYGGVEITNKDFTPYKYLMAYATHTAGDVNFVTIINTINTNENYTASSSSITAGVNLHLQGYKMTNSSIIANRVGYYQNVVANNFTNWQDRSITDYHDGYIVYKIEGVLK